MTSHKLFPQHITQLRHDWSEALQHTLTDCDGILVHSGSAHHYFADDQAPPFRAWGHFLRWVPLDRPDQFVLFTPDQKPRLLAVVPRDFWHDQTLETQAWWADCLEITLLESTVELAECLPQTRRLAFLGEDRALAGALGIHTALINPARLLAWLDYERASKTDYEVARLREANAQALHGHAAARDVFLNEGDEYAIHHAYLGACRVLDAELPYPNIIALNEKSAILHYQHKRRYADRASKPANDVLLIDAGCRAYGYCSDITRTWASVDTHPVFHELLQGVQKLQAVLVDRVRPGTPFPDLHAQAHLQIAELLLATGVCHGDAEALVDGGISSLFFPHGLGHLLGLQVHDVGGRLANREGELTPPPGQWPALRNTRTLEPGMVVTIEPGLYIIPTLLETVRGKAGGDAINWQLADELAPLGGIRIEDNVLVTGQAAENLTRDIAATTA